MAKPAKPAMPAKKVAPEKMTIKSLRSDAASNIDAAVRSVQRQIEVHTKKLMAAKG